MNVFDYLYWRSDLTFKERPFNYIDNLIMARISYLPLDRVVTRRVTIKEAYNKCLDYAHFDHFYHEDDLKMFKILAESARYKDLCLSNFVNIIDKKKEQQFCAITIYMPHTIYISYRGTDNTLVGFKEDFNMSFLDKVPSQEEALNYLNMVGSVNPFSKILVGGHSKGGNLAIYASLYCKTSIRNRITSVYNNDGPGFLKNITESDNYKELKPCIHTFIPKTSIVGRLLNNSGDYKVVDSTQKLILQHDLYSWILDKSNFKYLDNVDTDSDNINNIINDWVDKVTIEERKQFVDTIYNIIKSTKAETLDDLNSNWFNTITKIVGSYINCSKEEKEILNKVFDYLFNSFKNNLITKAQ